MTTSPQRQQTSSSCFDDDDDDEDDLVCVGSPAYVFRLIFARAPMSSSRFVSVFVSISDSVSGSKAEQSKPNRTELSAV